VSKLQKITKDYLSLSKREQKEFVKIINTLADNRPKATTSSKNAHKDTLTGDYYKELLQNDPTFMGIINQLKNMGANESRAIAD